MVSIFKVIYWIKYITLIQVQQRYAAIPQLYRFHQYVTITICGMIYCRQFCIIIGYIPWMFDWIWEVGISQSEASITYFIFLTTTVLTIVIYFKQKFHGNCSWIVVIMKLLMIRFHICSDSIQTSLALRHNHSINNMFIFLLALMPWF